MPGYVSDLMRDGDCIQLGFGGIPNAIGFHLMEKHDLGIHTEQIGTAMAHLMACGAVTNRCKPSTGALRWVLLSPGTISSMILWTSIPA